MTAPKIGVVIPTVDGREEMLETVVLPAYLDKKLAPFRIEIMRGFDNCGEAWNEGAARLIEHGCDYLHFGADDLYPLSPLWHRSALHASENHCLPGAYLYDTAGNRTQDHDGPHWSRVTFSRVPFLPVSVWRQVGPIPPLHYYSDCYLGAKCYAVGQEIRLVAGYAFCHLWAQPGRITDDSKDRELYEQRLKEL